MHSERTLGLLEDIRLNIGHAERFVADLTPEQLEFDTLRLYATIRSLEIISEASRGLPDDLKARHHEIPWRDMAGAGNIYRHNYDNVAARRLWDTVHSALPPLRSVVEKELGQS